jgi:hypothetical protein
VDPGVGLESLDAGLSEYLEHRPLTGRSRSPRSTRQIEDAPQSRDATLPLVALQLSLELSLGRKSAIPRLGDDAFQLLLVK